jgi:hypothetical protein
MKILGLFNLPESHNLAICGSNDKSLARRSGSLRIPKEIKRQAKERCTCEDEAITQYFGFNKYRRDDNEYCAKGGDRKEYVITVLGDHRPLNSKRTISIY